MTTEMMTMMQMITLMIMMMRKKGLVSLNNLGRSLAIITCNTLHYILLCSKNMVHSSPLPLHFIEYSNCKSHFITHNLVSIAA